MYPLSVGQVIENDLLSPSLQELLQLQAWVVPEVINSEKTLLETPGLIGAQTLRKRIKRLRHEDHRLTREKPPWEHLLEELPSAVTLRRLGKRISLPYQKLEVVPLNIPKISILMMSSMKSLFDEEIAGKSSSLQARLHQHTYLGPSPQINDRCMPTGQALLKFTILVPANLQRGCELSL
jgi:hypothetical protein